MFRPALLTLLLIASQAVAQTSPADELTKAIKDNRKADNDLKHSYQELVVKHKQGVTVATELGKVNSAMLNEKNSKQVQAALAKQANKLEADLAQRKAAIQPMETAYKAQQKTVLDELDRTVVPPLQALTSKLDASTLKAVDGLFDFFVIADQKELAGLTITASFADQEVWKEAAKCVARHGLDQIASIRRMLGSKFPAAKYAAAVALGLIGEGVYNEDANLYLTIVGMKTDIAKSGLDENEKRVRQKLLETALAEIRPGR